MERIILQNISKHFNIGFKKRLSMLERVLSIFSGREQQKTIQVLTNISFSANNGEIIGIIGKNGSGKSTLLRAIARIYKIDEGKITTRGKIVPLINLNLGMQDRLTMKDNIFLCCSLFGLTEEETKQKFSPIVEFSGLSDFTSTKIYQFSEGMKQKLAFSIAIHSNPEILLLDEIFEIGDENFRKKSTDKIKELVKKGAVVLLVSHDLELVKRHCSRIIWMDKGKIFREGNKEDIEEYLKS